MDTKDLIFTVASISCGHCVSAITAEVTQVGGVVEVAIDLETKAVVVTGCVGEVLDESAIRRAIVEAGYEVAS